MTQRGNTEENASALDDGLLALTLALALVIGLRFIDSTYDDAYITYRYARNLASGHGLVYNLGQDFLGTTTPLYSLLLAGLNPLLPIPKASGLISLGSLLGAIFFCEVLGRQNRIRFAGSMAALFLVTEPQIYQIFGGETLLVYFHFCHYLGKTLGFKQNTVKWCSVSLLKAGDLWLIFCFLCEDINWCGYDCCDEDNRD